jgi:hypothetical protein
MGRVDDLLAFAHSTMDIVQPSAVIVTGEHKNFILRVNSNIIFQCTGTGISHLSSAIQYIQSYPDSFGE